ncbi:Crp/Fnr family transcriptional regulator [Sinirhodobacter sp. WL0062]|uniref:Crp/Fnr family transcriptional regulator n=1 Tax=Rhodobacter flavimaris TaxID=2907145 RepID=A0ABS8Z151_9RHOB|nr:Crp/Fnr family transcriptional regulator [Sinirhodobacter sp. WL0062]MCE5974411.1 Crp/Fnr family transcriptional regulator [Sinirhodobacter sp. WL0062]
MTIHFSEGLIASPMFSGLAPKSVERLMRVARPVRFRRGENIFLHQSRADCCYVILSGWVKLYRVTPNGNEALVRMHSQFETVGFCDGLRDQVHSYGAEAASICRLLSLPTAEIRALAAEDQEFASRLLAHTLSALEQMFDQVESLKTQTAIQRVAAFLLRHARRVEGRTVVELPFEKSLVAAHLGIKPESLSRVLARLKAHGLALNQSEIEVVNRDLLEGVIRSDPADAWA